MVHLEKHLPFEHKFNLQDLHEKLVSVLGGWRLRGHSVGLWLTNFATSVSFKINGRPCLMGRHPLCRLHDTHMCTYTQTPHILLLRTEVLYYTTTTTTTTTQLLIHLWQCKANRDERPFLCWGTTGLSCPSILQPWLKALLFVGPFACYHPWHSVSPLRWSGHLLHIPLRSQDKVQSRYAPKHTANVYAVGPAKHSQSLKLDLCLLLMGQTWRWTSVG